jgi:hypothetical protein
MGKKKKAKIPRSLQRKRRERNRKQDTVRKSRDKLIAKARARSRGGDVVVFPSEVKMSEVIIEFAEPLMERAMNYEDEKKALTMAIGLWNLSVLPLEKRAEEIETLIGALGGSESDPENDAENRNLIQLFIDRKERLFPDIERLILDYDMVETPKGLHLNVVSSLSEKEAKLAESGMDQNNQQN